LSVADAAAAAESHKERGNAHFKSKEFARAAAAYGDAIKLRPSEASFWLNRSIAYRQMEDWDQAEADAANSLFLQPDSEKALYGRALALQKLGRAGEASKACEAGLEAHPGHKALMELQAALLAPSKPEAAKPAAKKSYDIDYSKWKDLEDSDDEGGKGAAEPNVRVSSSLKKGMDWTGPKDMLELCTKVYEEDMFQEPEPPKAASLPRDHMRPMGIMTLSDLGKYTCSNERMLVSVYGDIHDVSSRPDIYGYGPKSFQSGKDVTWSVIVGDETPQQCNRFYDIFKLDEDHLKRYLQIVCQRLVQLRETCGEPVGRLENFVNERMLPPPPKDEVEECKQQ